MSKSKNVVIGISGGIAVYKVASLVRLFRQANIGVDVIMTDNATQFVTPLTFETLSNRPVTTDMFNRNKSLEVEHISLAQKADLFVLAPATANIIGKFANGIADDMLSTTLMATCAPIVVCPAMNTNMYDSFACTANRKTLAGRGVHFVDSGIGELACGDVGKGRMAEPQQIFDHCMRLLMPIQDLLGKNVLVTLGATSEPLDDVRVITNKSSGRMGTCIVDTCLERGANVIVVSGARSVDINTSATIVDVVTTQDMFDAVMDNISQVDIAIMAAAPCDYRPMKKASSKLKTDNLTIDFVKNIDIAASVGNLPQKPLLVVFSAETDNGVDNTRGKLIKKNADFAVLNMVTDGAVFGRDNNSVTIIDKAQTIDYPLMSKTDVAKIIIDKVVSLL